MTISPPFSKFGATFSPISSSNANAHSRDRSCSENKPKYISFPGSPPQPFLLSSQWIHIDSWAFEIFRSTENSDHQMTDEHCHFGSDRTIKCIELLKISESFFSIQLASTRTGRFCWSVFPVFSHFHLRARLIFGCDSFEHTDTLPNTDTGAQRTAHHKPIQWHNGRSLHSLCYLTYAHTHTNTHT